MAVEDPRSANGESEVFVSSSVATIDGMLEPA